MMPRGKNPFEYLKIKPAKLFISFRRDNNTENYVGSEEGEEEQVESRKKAWCSGRDRYFVQAASGLGACEEKKGDANADRVTKKSLESRRQNSHRMEVSKKESGAYEAMYEFLLFYRKYHANEKKCEDEENNGSLEKNQTRGGNLHMANFCTSHLSCQNNLQLMESQLCFLIHRLKEDISQRPIVNPDGLTSWRFLYTTYLQVYRTLQILKTVNVNTLPKTVVYPIQVAYNVMPYGKIGYTLPP
eukprot:TRINITY_DN3826_c0_g1_i5.p1 TRINITY_DN3826_c0_g1~~TRINITY_DN3826_c0_g1_i5.p1  ORF type:complete len:244 (+),score=21.70 TRINITY_DN3826_c0_g1_i5:562-1293(+)